MKALARTQLLARMAVSLLAVVAGPAACGAALRWSEAATNATLSHGSPPASATPPAPGNLRVAHVSPGSMQGEPRAVLSSAEELSVVFDRPVRPLDAASEESLPSITVEPAVSGRWQWVGTAALRLVLERSLTPGTAYTLRVPAGVIARDGTRLEAPVTSAFTTPPVAAAPLVQVLTWRTPRHTATRHDVLPADARWVLLLGSPVSEAELRRGVHLDYAPPAPATSKAGAKSRDAKQEPMRSLTFSVSNPKPRDGRVVEVIPTAPLLEGSTVRVTVDAGLRSEDGEKTQPIPKVETFLVDSLAVRVFCAHGDDGNRDGVCDGRPPTLSLSRRVRRSELARALRVEPYLPVFLRAERSGDDFGHSFELVGAFRLGQRYRFSLPAGWTTDTTGAPARATEATLAFEKPRTSVDLALEGSILEASGELRAGVEAAGVKNLGVTTARVAPSDLLRSLALMTEREYSGGSEFVPASGRHRVTLGGGGGPFSVSQALGGEAHLGTLAVQVAGQVDGAGESPKRRRSRPEEVSTRRLLQVTDLGLTAKVSRSGSVVWVTRLSTGEPVSGAEVERLSPSGSTGVFVTDADGIVRLPAAPSEAEDANARESSPAVLVARSGEDSVFQPLTYGPLCGTCTYGFDTNRPRELFHGLLLTDRAVYRRGEKVRVKGVLRRQGTDGLTTPSGVPAGLQTSLPLADPSSGPVVTTEFGTFSTELSIPSDCRLGEHRLELQSPRPDDHSWGLVVARANIRVVSEDLAPTNEAPFALVAERTAIRTGEPARFRLRGEWAPGLPRANQTVTLSVSRESAPDELPDAPGFTTDDHAFSGREWGTDEDTEVTLDAEGSATVIVPWAPSGPGASTQRLTLSTRDGVKAETLIHSDTVVGLRATRGATPGEPLRVEVVGAGGEGKLRAGLKVRAELIQLVFDPRAALMPVQPGAPREHAVGACELVTAEAPVGCSFVPRGKGSYVVRARATGPSGTEAAASVYVHLGDVPPAPSTSRLEVVPDREVYSPGDTAHLRIKAPFDTGEALVTLERDRVLDSRRVTLGGGEQVIDLPLGATLSPNAFVSVVAVRGRSPHEDRDPRSRFAVGYALLEEDPRAHRLDVSVRPRRSDARPGDALDVDVQVRGSNGEPVAAEVTLYAYEAGPEQGPASGAPDVVKSLMASPPRGVSTLESRLELARRASSLSVRTASREWPEPPPFWVDEPAFEQPRDMGPNVAFEPALLTDAEGTAHARVNLPRRAAEVRVVALAVGKDARAGQGETSLKVSGQPAPIPLDEEGVRETQASPAAPAVDLESHCVGGVVTTTGAVSLQGFETLERGVGGVEVSLSASPLAAARGALADLLSTADDGPEASASRLVALLTLHDFALALGAPLPVDSKAVVAETLAKLIAAQRADGSFGVWTASSSNPWVTTYAWWALRAAKSAGEDVPDAALQKAEAFLRAQSARWEREPADWAVEAFFCDALAEQAGEDCGQLRRLFELGPRLPLSTQALTLHAMATLGSYREESAELARELAAQALVSREDHRLGAATDEPAAGELLDSPARTSAMVLRALLAVTPRHPGAEPLIGTLLAGRTQGGWGSPQASAWVLRALDDWRRAEPTPRGSHAEVFLADTRLASLRLSADSLAGSILSIPTAELPSRGQLPLTFALREGGPLHYDVCWKSPPAAVPEAAVEQGFFVSKSVRRVGDAARAGSPTPAGASSLREGDAVLVDITVVSTAPRNFVVIEDPLAPGLAWAPALGHVAAELGVVSSGEQSPWGRRTPDEERFIPRRELRAGRMRFEVERMSAGLFHYRYLARVETPGELRMPPATARAVYSPELFGRSLGETLEVAPRP